MKISQKIIKFFQKTEKNRFNIFIYTKFGIKIKIIKISFNTGYELWIGKSIILLLRLNDLNGLFDIEEISSIFRLISGNFGFYLNIFIRIKKVIIFINSISKILLLKHRLNSFLFFSNLINIIALLVLRLRDQKFPFLLQPLQFLILPLNSISIILQFFINIFHILLVRVQNTL